jgi:dinuclear metal center YbgI/SA1388 family protein
MTIKEILLFLESRAPYSLQESYDNSGLITGSPEMKSNGAVISLDCTEDVVDEAIKLGFNTIISHHPIVFSGLKRFTGRNYVERTIIKAIKNDIAIISIHTNLDNVSHGVNGMIAEKLGLINTRILDPVKEKLYKVVTYVPHDHAETVLNAMFDAGAGHIGNYSECSFSTDGRGTFKANENTNPFVGNIGERHTESETKLEVICPKWRIESVKKAMIQAHPYEEVAHEITQLDNKWDEIGAGMIGELSTAMETSEFLSFLKNKMNTGCVKYTQPISKSISKVAFCGGSGSFLLDKAIQQGADIFISSDFKYHQFFDADGRIIIADIGHFETEQYTIDLLSAWFAEKFPTFATHKTGVVTNPINYL